MTNYFQVGVVTHYFDKIGVCVITLDGDLSVGDTIKFERGGEDLFIQLVDSIQIEHTKVQSAKKGDVIGLGLKESIKEGAKVYKEARGNLG